MHLSEFPKLSEHKSHRAPSKAGPSHKASPDPGKGAAPSADGPGGIADFAEIFGDLAAPLPTASAAKTGAPDELPTQQAMRVWKGGERAGRTILSLTSAGLEPGSEAGGDALLEASGVADGDGTSAFDLEENQSAGSVEDELMKSGLATENSAWAQMAATLPVIVSAAANANSKTAPGSAEPNDESTLAGEKGDNQLKGAASQSAVLERHASEARAKNPPSKNGIDSVSDVLDNAQLAKIERTGQGKLDRESDSTSGEISLRAMRTAKLSEGSESTLQSNASADTGAHKKIQDAADETLVNRGLPVGTDVAKSVVAMSSSASSHRESSVAAPHAVPPMVAVAEATSVTHSSLAPAPVETANHVALHAVETLMSLAERFASADRHTVNLQFSIGGSDLHVRVELRANEVRTAFRTDSAELKAALTHEWQTVNGPASDRSPMRFADPVFSAAAGHEQGSSSFSSDTTSQQQRESATPRESIAPATTFSRPPAPGRDFSGPSTAVPFRSSDSLGSTPRLHTFA